MVAKCSKSSPNVYKLPDLAVLVVVYFNKGLGARTPNAGQNMHFNVFNSKKHKKGEKSKKFPAKFYKKHFFVSLHQNSSRVFYSQIKNFDANFLLFVHFFNFLAQKMLKIHLCTAPKRWSKYTTTGGGRLDLKAIKWHARLRMPMLKKI